MLPRTYSPKTVRNYLKRIRLAQQTGLTNFDEVFDPAISRLIKSHADAIACPRETILCSLLVAVASCMGPTAEIVVDSDWLEKPILWILVAGRRGDSKTPALNRVKSAVVGLEHELQALHRAPTSKQNTKFPPFLVDQNNFKQINDTLNMSSASQNLIGMFDNFGSFLRQCSIDSVFLDPNLLLSMYESTTNLHFNVNTTEAESEIYGNFLGMIEAIDAAALLEKFDADGLSDRVLVVCPKVSGCKQTINTVKDSHGNQTKLQTILSTIRNYHNIQKVSYTFREDGRIAFERCLAELDLWQSGFVYDERRRGVLAKAPGQLARLSAVLCALKNGLDLCAHGSNVHLIPSTAITADTVNAARQILMYMVNQKMSFLPNDESLAEDNSWDDMAENVRMEMTSPSLDLPQVLHKQVQEMVYLPQTEKNNRIEVRKSQSLHGAVISRERTNSEGSSVSNDQRNADVSRISQVSKIHEAFPRFINSPQVLSLANSDQASSSNMPKESKIHVPTTCRKRGSDDSDGGEIGSVKMVKTRPERPRRNQDDFMIYTVDDDSGNNALDDSNVSSEMTVRSSVVGIDVNQAIAGTSYGSNSWEFSPLDENHEHIFSYGRQVQFEKCNRLSSSFRCINMFELTDDQLLTQCALKIKKLLLLPGMMASSASICQKRLFPPVPKELRVEHPKTTHPVWGALAFLKRLVHMGLGELVHPLYRMQAIHFRKIRLEYMSKEARALFPRIDLDEEEYEKSYPKFDDSHMTMFALIEDIDQAVQQRLKADGQTIRRY